MKISAPRLGTKRKHIQRVIRQPKRFVNPLTANLALKATYNTALHEKERREKVWQDTLRNVEKWSRYMEKKAEKKTSNTIILPEIELRLSNARNYEIDLLIEKRKARFTPGSKFIILFKTRIGPIRNRWESVSVKLYTTIRDELASLSIRDKDVTFGLYEEKMSRGLSNHDLYRFLMYALIKDNRFNPQSGEYIRKIGGVITKLKKIKNGRCPYGFHEINQRSSR